MLHKVLAVTIYAGQSRELQVRDLRYLQRDCWDCRDRDRWVECDIVCEGVWRMPSWPQQDSDM